ncbi:MAG: hypothetical protein HY508_05860 [Acidobacteria bacterium]|nr:hypothetical protein [Acidobacteriota bacterium]
MSEELTTPNSEEPVASLSKRGARRVIQRAFVLMGRDKALRQRLKGVELMTRWMVEDWGLEWTVIIDRGRVEFHRGHFGKAQVSFLWKTGDDFLGQVASGRDPGDGFGLECVPALRRVLDLLLAAFCSTLRTVLTDPVDDDGVRLV